MGSISDLKHVAVKIEGGGDVFVLDNGAVIDAEADAMLQALHSRSTGGFLKHLDLLEKKGADNFMSKFYVGYGHKSIGDCGTTTIFLEGISMLAAKAIQHSKLYNGQEASTRYVDFSKQAFIDPTSSDLGNAILEKQREFYLSLSEPVQAHLKELFPITEGDKENTYNKAIEARAFDIARGFLPSGASTNIAWHSNLRQIADRLLFLRHHPLAEVRNVALAIEKAVMIKYPNSFSTKRYEDTEAYQDEIAKNYYYHNDQQRELTIDSSNIDSEKLNAYRELIEARPMKTEFPTSLNLLGDIKCSFKLDFGSFRDLQRHRALNQRMPLITFDLGFNKFYLESLPNDTLKRALSHLAEIELMVKDLDLSREDMQYLIPMGFNTANSFTGTLPALVYMVELRATRFVHPTLRAVAQDIAKYIRDEMNIPMHLDQEAGMFDVRRGEHDIVIEDDVVQPPVAV